MSHLSTLRAPVLGPTESLGTWLIRPAYYRSSEAEVANTQLLPGCKSFSS